PVFAVEVGDAPFLGKEDAKVTLVEFSDFECRYCGKAVETIEKIKKRYGKKVKIVFKNFPLPFHKNAKSAALAGLCANEQGGAYFWKIHDMMFADQKKLDVPNLIKAGEKAGLNLDQFTNCLNGKKHMAKLDQDIQQAKELGIKQTPTFFINGRMVNGLQDIDNFTKLIDQGLK
ncbi:MAG: DsbA family protein, partial [Halobacteriovoraceae bacterium]|nr:DsbA family protein [Halobacteriovoraceae bacterium]